jgi:DNA-binding CsgD family transcriptional regulator
MRGSPVREWFCRRDASRASDQLGGFNGSCRPIAVIRRQPKAYGADIPLPMVREPPLSGCHGWSGQATDAIIVRFTSGPYYRRAATAFIHSSMDDRDPLSRLTQREKVCLRQWLQHKSAKEIAADLGISHHAVEKRLKMARTKLGATSSLEAARMLGEAEGYGQAVPQSPDLVSDALQLHSAFTRLAVLGVAIMILVGAIVLGLLLQHAAFSQASSNEPPAPPAERVFTPRSVPATGTEAALRRLAVGLASGSPDYDKLSPQFAQVVRRDLPMTHPLFSSMGELKSMTFIGRGDMGEDFYNLVFAKGGVIMSANLDADGRMTGGILRPMAPGERVPTGGTEAALRRLVAGLASGSPDYDKLSPQFAGVVRRDLPMTHPLFSSMGELKSVTFLGRADMGDDVYNMVFAKGGVIMSASLDVDGRMTGGFFQRVSPPGH